MFVVTNLVAVSQAVFLLLLLDYPVHSTRYFTRSFYKRIIIMPSWRNGSASPSYSRGTSEGGRWGLRVRPPSTVKYLSFVFLRRCRHSIPLTDRRPVLLSPRDTLVFVLDQKWGRLLLPEPLRTLRSDLSLHRDKSALDRNIISNECPYLHVLSISGAIQRLAFLTLAFLYSSIYYFRNSRQAALVEFLRASCAFVSSRCFRISITAFAGTRNHPTVCCRWRTYVRFRPRRIYSIPSSDTRSLQSLGRPVKDCHCSRGAVRGIGKLITDIYPPADGRVAFGCSASQCVIQVDTYDVGGHPRALGGAC